MTLTIVWEISSIPTTLLTLQVTFPLPRRPKTAQVPSRQSKVTSGGSQPVTPETNRAPRAVSSMSYKIHKQASADDTSTDTAMFTMPKIGEILCADIIVSILFNHVQANILAQPTPVFTS